MTRLAPWLLLLSACGWGTGSSFMKDPLTSEEERASSQSDALEGKGRSSLVGPGKRARTIGEQPVEEPAATGGGGGVVSVGGGSSAGGRVLGTFRNTYYDFPAERAFSGPTMSLMNASCQPIATVPRAFHDALCVQGSGALAGGGTVSFAKRDCACAEICPRTGQKICFTALDRGTYPWGRGAAGTPIRPLRSIAADTNVLPMGTALYIPELEGAARADGSTSDGCFVVEDRGLKVEGNHVDIFSGDPESTAALNRQVPSNRGVTVIVDAPRCQRQP